GDDGEAELAADERCGGAAEESLGSRIDETDHATGIDDYDPVGDLIDDGTQPAALIGAALPCPPVLTGGPMPRRVVHAVRQCMGQAITRFGRWRSRRSAAASGVARPHRKCDDISCVYFGPSAASVTRITPHARA